MATTDRAPQRSSDAHQHGAMAMVLSLLCGALAPAGVCHAQAEPHQVSLIYERATGAESCLDGDALEAQVGARLGYDPFVSHEGADTIVVRIKPKSRGFIGSLERRGQREAARMKPTVITSKGSDCVELGDALALALAIAIDPLSLTRDPPSEPAQPAPQATLPEPAAPSQPTASSTPSEPSESPLEDDEPLPEVSETVTKFYAAGGPSIAFGALPKVSWGVRLLAGFSYDLFELDVEARFDPPVTVDTAGGSIETSLVLGTLAPCVRYGWVVACASLSFGALRGTGLGFDHERAENTLQSLLGTRMALDVPLSEHVSLRMGFESQFPLIATELRAGDELVWSTPAAAYSATVLAASRFP